MLIQRNESVITKKIKVLTNSSVVLRDFKKDTYQKFLRTTWSFLFIPIFKYDKRID